MVQVEFCDVESASFKALRVILGLKRGILGGNGSMLLPLRFFAPMGKRGVGGNKFPKLSLIRLRGGCIIIVVVIEEVFEQYVCRHEGAVVWFPDT